MKMKENIMLKSILTPALIALTFAGSAFAAETSTDAQLAGAAGVAAGQYTSAELQNIIEARRENDTTALNFYLKGGDKAAAAQDSSGQLAKQAGVAEGTYTVAELNRIIKAKIDNDRETVAYVVSGTNRTAPDAAGTVTPGKAQIASLLGVNAADYSLAQLVAMEAAVNADN